MIAGVKPYPRYRDSGVPWLGKVPEQWEVVRTRYLLREIDQRSPDGTETHLSMSQKLGLVPTSMVEQRTLVSESYAGGKLCEEDDIVLNRLKAHLGVFALAQQNGVISPDYTVLRKTRPMTVKYFEHALKSPACRSELRVRAKGIVEGFWRLYTDDLYDIRLPVPPVAEQAAIIRYLDHADRRIRRYIAAKTKLIALLNEQKQAIIHRAVTRGLDPSVRLKPSGLGWLGAVPEHWSVLRNKAVLSPRKRTVGIRSTEFTLLSLTLRGVIPRDLENPEGKFPADFGTYQVVEPGDLVFCLFDMDETPRTVGIAPVRGMVTGAYSVFACIDRDTASFLYHFYLAMDAQKRLRPFYTGLRKVVQNDTFMGIPVAIPPHEEMLEILSAIAAEMTRIDGAIERTEREVHLVQEFRTRLMSDIVTGKLDVRHAAEELPESDEGAGPLDDADAILDGDESEDEADLDAAAGDVVA